MKKQLFFSRADKFEDPFEGKYNKPSADELIRSNLKQIPKENRTKKNVEKAKHEADVMKEQHDEKRTSVTISS